MAEIESSDGMVTYTTNSGQRITMTESAFEKFIADMDLTISDLEITRGMVTNGEVTRIRGELDFVVNPAMIERVDTLNLKLGGFDDAMDLQEVYRENFYKGRAEQIERIYHGYDTGKVVSEEIMTGYMDNDGNVAADVATLDSEFESRNAVDDSDVAEVDSENTQEEQTYTPDEEPGSDQESGSDTPENP